MTVFIMAAVMFLLLPFWTSFQDLLTRFVMQVGWYKQLQNIVVPYEIRVAVTVLTGLGLPVRAGNTYLEWSKAGGGNEVIYIIWNCVGWQTLVLLAITFITGFSGKHTILSKIEALVIGLLGTYLVNITRIVLVIIVYFLGGRPVGSVFHDYFSGTLTFIWLLFFWWFVYSYVLEEKETNNFPKSTRN